MNRIKELRKQKGVTAKELAEMLQISQSMLTNYENGSSTPRDSSVWEKLADFFDVTQGYIMGVSDNVHEIEKLTFSEIMDDDFVKNGLKPVEIKLQSRAELDLFTTLSVLDTEDIEKTLNFVIDLVQDDKYKNKQPSFVAEFSND